MQNVLRFQSMWPTLKSDSEQTVWMECQREIKISAIFSCNAISYLTALMAVKKEVRISLKCRGYDLHLGRLSASMTEQSLFSESRYVLLTRGKDLCFASASCSSTPVRRLSAKIAVPSKVSFWISSENQTYEHYSELPYQLKSTEFFIPKVKNRATSTLLIACFVMFNYCNRFAWITLRHHA